MEEISTTMVFVNLLTAILNDKNISKFIVPIVADEARTFGLQSLLENLQFIVLLANIFSRRQGRTLYYKESKNGQILEEGINELGQFLHGLLLELHMPIMVFNDSFHILFMFWFSKNW